MIWFRGDDWTLVVLKRVILDELLARLAGRESSRDRAGGITATIHGGHTAVPPSIQSLSVAARTVNEVYSCLIGADLCSGPIAVRTGAARHNKALLRLLNRNAIIEVVRAVRH